MNNLSNLQGKPFTVKTILDCIEQIKARYGQPYTKAELEAMAQPLDIVPPDWVQELYAEHVGKGR